MLSPRPKRMWDRLPLRSKHETTTVDEGSRDAAPPERAGGACSSTRIHCHRKGKRLAAKGTSLATTGGRASRQRRRRSRGGFRVSRSSIALLAGLTMAATVAVGEQPTSQGMQAPSASGMGQVAAPEAMVSGEVIETAEAGRYTYIQVDTGGEKIWVAAPNFAVAVGDSVVVPPGAPMKDYHSKTLDRSFETVYFVGLVTVEGAEAAAPTTADEAPVGLTKTEPADLDLSGIDKAEGGMTVGEIYDAKDTLAGQTLAVRGRVVKFTPGIMGKNWLHLRDGTAGAGGNNDLTVTTAAEAEVGNTVLVRGMVATDRDFGFGYRYELIIEEASVTVD